MSAKFHLKQQIPRQRLISKIILTCITGSPVIISYRRWCALTILCTNPWRCGRVPQPFCGWWNSVLASVLLLLINVSMELALAWNHAVLKYTWLWKVCSLCFFVLFFIFLKLIIYNGFRVQFLVRILEMKIFFLTHQCARCLGFEGLEPAWESVKIKFLRNSIETFSSSWATLRVVFWILSDSPLDATLWHWLTGLLRNDLLAQSLLEVDCV